MEVFNVYLEFKNAVLKTNKFKDSSKNKVYVIQTHSDMPINNRLYLQEELEKAVNTFTDPFKKPILLYHDDWSEPIGRVNNQVYYPKASVGEAENYYGVKINVPEESTGFVLLECEIMNESIYKKIEDGIYNTVSIGFRAKQLTCNICGADITDIEDYLEHEHQAGKVYDGRTMYVVPHGIVFDEISYVNTPADPYAVTIKLGEKEEISELEFVNYVNDIVKSSIKTQFTDENNVDPVNKEYVNSDNGGIKMDDKLKQLEDKVAGLESKINSLTEFVDSFKLKQKEDFVNSILDLKEKLGVINREENFKKLIGKDEEFLSNLKEELEELVVSKQEKSGDVKEEEKKDEEMKTENSEDTKDNEKTDDKHEDKKDSEQEKKEDGEQEKKEINTEEKNTDSEKTEKEENEENEKKINDSVVSYQDLSLADESVDWDGSKARQNVKKWATKDNDEIDWQKYRKAFLWYDSEKPDIEGSYKLPIANVFDGTLKAVPKGIYAAAGAVQGSRGGVDIPKEDKEKVKKHLDKYYAKLKKDPPWKEDSNSEAKEEDSENPEIHIVDKLDTEEVKVVKKSIMDTFKEIGLID